MLLSRVRFFKAMHIEYPERGRQPAGLDVTNSHSASSWFNKSGRVFYHGRAHQASVVVGNPMPTATALLLQQTHLANFHTLVDGLAHIVQSQGCDTGGCQGFHFHTGLAGKLAPGQYMHRCAVCSRSKDRKSVV